MKLKYLEYFLLFILLHDSSAFWKDEFSICIDKFGQKSVPDVIRSKGYPVEIHHVTTEDGYILTLHRIPKVKHYKNDGYWKSKKNYFPVLMQHGLLSSAASWVLELPVKTPAFYFADEGYDVWLNNARGSFYSRNHTHYTTNDWQYWDFSFDEMGYYDIPTVIDYILKETKREQLYYIGHSMGTTMLFAGLSRRPEYNQYIKEMFALGPVGTVSHITTDIKYLSYVSELIETSLHILGVYDFMPQSSLALKILKNICTKYPISEEHCSNFIFFITGSDWKEYDETWLPIVLSQLLSGTSLNTVLHYAQEYKAGQFQRYDYGYFNNYRRYGQFFPPQYKLDNVTITVNLVWGLNDYLADPEDVKYLIQNLKNIRYKKEVRDPDFNHLDFLWAKHMYDLVYSDVLQWMHYS